MTKSYKILHRPPNSPDLNPIEHLGRASEQFWQHRLIWQHTVGMESIQTPLNFSLFVILQSFAKII